MAQSHEFQSVAEGALGEGGENSPAERGNEGVGDGGNRIGVGHPWNSPQKKRKGGKTAQGIEIGKTERAGNGKQQGSGLTLGHPMGNREGGQLLGEDCFKTGTAAELD